MSVLLIEVPTRPKLGSRDEATPMPLPSEWSYVWSSDGNTIVANYNDSRSAPTS